MIITKMGNQHPSREEMIRKRRGCLTEENRVKIINIKHDSSRSESIKNTIITGMILYLEDVALDDSYSNSLFIRRVDDIIKTYEEGK